MKQNVYSTKIIETIEDLDTLKDQWDFLANNCINQSFYHEWYWYFALASHLTSHIKFITVNFGEALVAVVPIDIESADIVQIPHCSQTDLTDIVVHRDHCNTVLLNAIVANFSILSPNWSRFEIFNTPEQGAFRKLLSQCKLPFSLDADKENFFFDTLNEKCLQKISKKMRKNVKRQQKSLTNEIGEGIVVDANIDQFIQLDKESWKGQESQTDIQSNSNTESFIRALSSSLGANGQLHLSAYKINNRIISAQFGIKVNNRLSLLKIAYLSELQKYGPGNQHLLSTIVSSIADSQITEVNLTTGPKWADRWHPCSSRVYNICIYNRTLKGLCFWGLENVKKLARPIKQKINTWVQR